MKAMIPELVSSVEAKSPDGEAFREALKNHIFDLPGPRYANLGLTGRRKFVSQVFRGFSEVSISLQTLEDLRFLVGKFPFNGTRISADRYLQIHAEAFLTEIYLLKARLERYLKFIEREYKNDPRHGEIKAKLKVLLQTVRSSLKNVVEIRDAHTHQERFKDDGISRLGTISMIERASDGKMAKLMKGYYYAEHARQKQRWRKTIANYIKGTRQLLNLYFGTLQPLLFDRMGSPRYPQRLVTREKA